MQAKKRPEYIIIAFVLIALSLIGIIVVQTYWTVNAYRQNKRRFDINIDSAMSAAMKDCRQEYNEVTRRVLIERLSAPDISIATDSMPAYTQGGYKTILVFRLNTTANLYVPESSIELNKEFIEYYRKKVWYVNPSDTPAWLTEIALYQPDVMKTLMAFLRAMDVKTESKRLLEYIQEHPNSAVDSLLRTFPRAVKNGVDQIPKNYRRSDSITLSRNFENELKKRNITNDFNLVISKKWFTRRRSGIRYSETRAVEYQYHGFAYFKNNDDSTLYIKAVINNPQYAIMRSMVVSLMISALLILSTTGCFVYILRTLLKQKKLAELKDDFINNMTHELKTPLATITVAIEGLQKFNALNDTEKTERYLETSRNELNKLNDLVTKVLNIASFENNGPDLNKQDVNIDELVAEVVASETTKAVKTVNITYANTDQVETISADKLHLRNVLLNLVDNAVKYSGDRVDIAIVTYKEDGMLCFAVRDNGMGISADNLKNIFEKFYRVPTGNLHNVKGTGLGLSYAKAIIEAHGGTLMAKSELNKGSEFIFTLPLS
jgi:signal transduction histidine kinase